jgi:uncharacterized protein
VSASPHPATVTACGDGVRLTIRVSPRASRASVGPVREDGALVVSVTSPPVEGEANAQVIKVLAKWLGLPPRCVTIQHGERGRNKVVEATEISLADVCERLRGLAG